MTNKEKRERKKAREELRKMGILPPPKKRLNRKAFIAMAKNSLPEMATLDMIPFLLWALGEMLQKHEYTNSAYAISPEAVGVAKAILLAARRSEFEKARDGEQFTLGDLFNAVEDIYNA